MFPRSFGRRYSTAVSLTIVMALMVQSSSSAQVTSTWNSTTGTWSDATRWSTNPLFPNNGNGGNTYNAVINGGTVTLDQDIEIEGLTFSGGTINGNFDLDANANSTWTNGTMSGTGTTTIGSSGLLAISGTTVGAVRTVGRRVVNDGTVNWTGNRWLTFTGGTFDNNNSFTINSSSLLDAGGGGGTNAFNNAGTFVKQGTGTAQFTNGVVFNNSGTVEVQNGTLRLDAGGTHTGDFNIASGATLTFTGAHAVEGVTDINGPGTFRISTGTTSFNGNTTIGALTLDSSLAVLSGTGTATLTGASTWTNGTMAGTGQTVIGTGGSLQLNATAVGAVLQLDRTLVNDGSVTWLGNKPMAMNNGTFQNNNSFTINSSSLLDAGGGGGTNAFNNAGTFVKQGTGTAQFTNGVVFNNSGSVDVQAGTLRLDAGGTHTGDFNIAATRTLVFSGTHIFTGTSEITGTGTFSLGTTSTHFDGQTTIQAAMSLGSVLATLTGTGTVTINGASTWTNGTMAGTGQTVIGAGGSLAISGTGLGIVHQLDRTLVNDNTVTWTGSHLSWNDGTFQNNANLSVSAPSGIDNFSTGGTNVLDNAGTLTKTGAGLVWFHDGVAFNNSGSVDIQGGGLRLDTAGTHSGDFLTAMGTTLTLNSTHTFTGAAAINGTGTFSNLGTVELSSGSLAIQPNLAQQVGSDLLSGTWRVLNGSALNVASGSNITRSFASVTIAGVGASFSKFDSLVDNQGSFTIADGYNFTALGPFTNGGSLTVGTSSNFSAPGGFTQTSNGSLHGSGTVTANIINSGAIRPGNSPGILNINGDLTLTGASFLEIEIGGETPGTEHDQVNVTGSATVGGRLELPILPGYVPMVGDEIEFLTASAVTGSFATVRSVGLEAANPNIAIDIVPSATDLKVVFVAPETDVDFVSTSTTAIWSDPATWTSGTVPDTENTPEIDNLAGAAQSVAIVGDDAFVHNIQWQSTADPLTLEISTGRSLSAITGAAIGDQGIVELDAGTVVTSTLEIEAGGKLAGNGTVVGDLVVGDGGSTMAQLSPGFSVGHLDVEGDYEQQANGNLTLDIEGTTSGEFDTLDITGSASLDGTVVVDASALASLDPGMAVTVLTADGGLSGSEFDEVITIGADDIYFAPVYSTDEVALLQLYVGDMDQLGDGVTENDVPVFALALTNPRGYSDNYGSSADSSGDMDFDGDCDVDDIDEFADMVGMSLVELTARIRAYSANVPEPGSVLLLCIASLVLGLRRKLPRA